MTEIEWMLVVCLTAWTACRFYKTLFPAPKETVQQWCDRTTHYAEWREQ